MVLISPSVHGLQRLIDTCRINAEDFDIIYNETKTQCMSLLPRSLKHIAEPQIFLRNHRLEFVHEFPYLGHISTDYLKDTADIEQRHRKLCATGNMIARRFAFCHRDVKLLLFRITVVHNDILKRLTNTPRYHSATQMFIENHLDNLKIIVIVGLETTSTHLDPGSICSAFDST
ncbi:uncharacterized protein LOC135225258 [Macrobrachium nipponense]|uniref:uncharacterized protein LOC135225258 n=1 Tax=Macrobrachium nipponense TaxID=159736 RepID=UPI0030C7EEC2